MTATMEKEKKNSWREPILPWATRIDQDTLPGVLFYARGNASCCTTTKSLLSLVREANCAEKVKTPMNLPNLVAQ